MHSSLAPSRKMASFLSNFNRLFRVAFVFQTVGTIFLQLSDVASIVRKYVYGNTETNTTMDVEAFTAEAQTLLYLTPDLVMSSARQFHQFHDLTHYETDYRWQPYSSVKGTTVENVGNHC